MNQAIKAGDKVRVKDNQDIPRVGLNAGAVHTVERVVDATRVYLVGLSNLRTVDGFFSYSRFELVVDPIEEAQRELEEAQQRVVEAQKKLADLRDPPVMVGQKRTSTHSRTKHEIIFIDEVTATVVTRFVLSARGTPGAAIYNLHTVRQWPLVS